MRLPSRKRMTTASWLSFPHALLRAARPDATTTHADVVARRRAAAGLVGVNVCAIDEMWSGLKLVIRKKLGDIGPLTTNRPRTP